MLDKVISVSFYFCLLMKILKVLSAIKFAITVVDDVHNIDTHYWHFIAFRMRVSSLEIMNHNCGWILREGAEVAVKYAHSPCISSNFNVLFESQKVSDYRKRINFYFNVAAK